MPRFKTNEKSRTNQWTSQVCELNQKPSKNSGVFRPRHLFTKISFEFVRGFFSAQSIKRPLYLWFMKVIFLVLFTAY